MRSLNLQFTGRGLDAPDGEHPPGGAWIRALRTDLAAAGWAAEEPDDWRDSGWIMECRRATSEIQVVLAEAGEDRDRWLVQVSPARLPGALLRLFGRRPSASAEDCHQAGLVIHETVQRLRPQATYWRWDGFPDVDRSSSTPPAPPAGERRHHREGTRR